MEHSYQPLAGIRVVEISHMIMGPSAGFFLASLGAEVIKIEPPDGDNTRKLTGMGRGFFPSFNRGKKSVVLDTKTPEGLATLHQLISSADVFLEKNPIKLKIINVIIIIFLIFILYYVTNREHLTLKKYL